MAKKLFIGMFLPIIFLSGCKNEVLPISADPVLIFSCSGCANSASGDFVEFNLSRNDNKNTNIQIMSSGFAKGLCIEKNKENVSVNYSGLELKHDNLFLPKDSFIKAIINVFDYLDEGAELEFVSNENGVTTKRSDNGSFEIDIFVPSGFIKEIRMLKDNITIALGEHEHI